MGKPAMRIAVMYAHGPRNRPSTPLTWAGPPTELDAPNGAVVRMGREYGVPTLVDQFINVVLAPLKDGATT